MQDQEKTYEVIYKSEGITAGELKSQLNMKKKELDKCLDTLYQNGFIDRIRGKYVAVKEEEILETYLNRNVDLYYLRESIDSELIESMLSNEFGDLLEEIKSRPMGGLDWKISELERKVKILSMLYKNLRELKKIT